MSFSQDERNIALDIKNLLTKINLKALELIDQNAEILHDFKATSVRQLSKHVGIRKVYNEIRNRWQLEIVIDSQTKQVHITDPEIWDLIYQEQQKLVGLQGRDFTDHFYVLLESITNEEFSRLVKDETAPETLPFSHKVSKGKPKYRELLMDTNFDLLVFLVRMSKENRERAKIASHFFTSLLKMFKWEDDQIREWCHAGLEELKEDRCPWDIKESPIEFLRFRNRLYNLRKSYQPGQAPKESKRNLLKVFMHFVRWGDWHDAERLLKKDHPDSYRKYKGRMQFRLSEILKVNE